MQIEGLEHLEFCSEFLRGSSNAYELWVRCDECNAEECEIHLKDEASEDPLHYGRRFLNRFITEHEHCPETLDLVRDLLREADEDAN